MLQDCHFKSATKNAPRPPLLEYETLTGDEINALLGGVKPSRNDDSGKNDSENLSGSVPKTGKKTDSNSKPGLQGA